MIGSIPCEVKKASNAQPPKSTPSDNFCFVKICLSEVIAVEVEAPMRITFYSSFGDSRFMQNYFVLHQK